MRKANSNIDKYKKDCKVIDKQKVTITKDPDPTYYNNDMLRYFEGREGYLLSTNSSYQAPDYHYVLFLDKMEIGLFMASYVKFINY